jgi:hypothetical protein
MIRDDRMQHALRSLSSILTRARWMAHESKAFDLAELLDAAEILPKYIAQEGDATEDFRLTVEAISQQFENCSHLADEFNQDCACAW